MIENNSPSQVTTPDVAPSAAPSEESRALELYDRIEAGDHKPTGYFDEPEGAPPVEEQKLAPEAPAPEQEFEFQYKGQTVKGPLSKILKWASQGYDYSQSMQAFKQTQQQFEHERSRHLETYEPIDKWVSNNPDKWERLQRAIDLEEQGLGEIDPNNPLLGKVQELETKLADILSEREQIKAQKEDEALDATIKSIREKYKDLDWDGADESGLTREMRVIAHANKHRFPTFEAAFKDLHFEELLTLKESRAREAMAAEKQRQAKAGIVSGKSPTLRPKAVTKKTSYDSAANDALEELKAGVYG